MKNPNSTKKPIFFVGVPLITAAFLIGCDVQVKEEGELPSVDVDVKADGGQLPEYEVVKTQEGELPSVDVNVDADAGKLPKLEVETPDIEVGKKTVDVPVPDVDVKVEDKQVTVPTVSIEMPSEEEKSE